MSFVITIPEYISATTQLLKDAGFSAYIVGGSVRDSILGIPPTDWDITTSATPEQIQSVFPDSFYENTFGTVGVKIRTEGEEVIVVEITPYRTEGTYSDGRHPDSVSFGQSIQEDLLRRDFTMNAIAYDPTTKEIVDPFDGISAIKNKTIRAVGEAHTRFGEDALRIIRMVRFVSQLGYSVDYQTLSGAQAQVSNLARISQERIRDEFTKLMMTSDPVAGIHLLAHIGALEHTIPELAEGIGCEQKGEHLYDVFEHLCHALDHAVKKNWPLHIRISALFHDIGKPRTRRWDGTKAGGKGKYTFFGHEVVGARMTKDILERLRYTKKEIKSIIPLVRWHMFFSDTEQITLSAVRRMIQNVTDSDVVYCQDFADHPIWDLMRIRECDRRGMKKSEAPYRLRKYHAMIEEALRAPISVKMLKIDGGILQNKLSIAPGKRMGWILHALLEECLEDETNNSESILEARALLLNQLSDSELQTLGTSGKEKQALSESVALSHIRKKHNL